MVIGSGDWLVDIVCADKGILSYRHDVGSNRSLCLAQPISSNEATELHWPQITVTFVRVRMSGGAWEDVGTGDRPCQNLCCADQVLRGMMASGGDCGYWSGQSVSFVGHVERVAQQKV